MWPIRRVRSVWWQCMLKVLPGEQRDHVGWLTLDVFEVLPGEQRNHVVWRTLRSAHVL
jgi:hypothetical protein